MGNVAVAINKGTKSEPKFDAPVDIKGVDTLTEKINDPTGCTMDSRTGRGNIYGYISVLPGARPARMAGRWCSSAAISRHRTRFFKLVSISVDGRDDGHRFLPLLARPVGAS